jgi:hypothetical protein
MNPARRRTVYLDHRTIGWMVGIRKLASTADQCEPSGSGWPAEFASEFEPTPVNEGFRELGSSLLAGFRYTEKH